MTALTAPRKLDDFTEAGNENIGDLTDDRNASFDPAEDWVLNTRTIDEIQEAAWRDGWGDVMRYATDRAARDCTDTNDPVPATKQSE